RWWSSAGRRRWMRSYLPLPPSLRDGGGSSRRVEADVEDAGGVGEGAHADHVDAGLGDGAHGLEGDAAGGFEHHPSPGAAHRLAKVVQAEVVEQDHVRRL